VAEREPLSCFSLLSQPKKKISPTKQKIEPIAHAVFGSLLLDRLIPDSDTTVLRHEQVSHTLNKLGTTSLASHSTTPQMRNQYGNRESDLMAPAFKMANRRPSSAKTLASGSLVSTLDSMLSKFPILSPEYGCSRMKA
jgi:hypothetical protein